MLAYHRVGRVTTDPQLLCVTPEHFTEHLELITKRYEPARLDELVAATRPDRAVAVTFDDGYADTLLAAKPLLERAGVHATVFVATGCIRDGRRFWWDELERLLLRPGRLPATLSLDVNGEILEWELGDDAAYPADRAIERFGWNVLDSRCPGPRQRIYRDLCARLRLLDDARRDRVLGQLASLADTDDAGETPPPLTPSQLRELAQGELMDIGAHTVTHPVLSQLAEEGQREEVVGSKRDLEEAVDTRVTSFAYPYGGPTDFDETTVSVVRAAGFDCACSTVPGRLRRTTNAFRMPRVVVRDWSGEELQRVLVEA